LFVRTTISARPRGIVRSRSPSRIVTGSFRTSLNSKSTFV
jgi:hypothetical protein